VPRIKGASRLASSQDTAQRLVAATVELLSTVGYARTTVRAIGERAGCNPALVSYHFGSLNNLLLAALDASSGARLERYDAELAGTDSWRELRRVLRRLYREDREVGHVRLLGEMVAGGLMDRELGAQVADRVEPWVRLVEATMRRLLPRGMRRRLAVAEFAYGVVAAFLGLELLGNLGGDHARSDAAIDKVTASQTGWRDLLAGTGNGQNGPAGTKPA
jgi:AcrR family transcriptional regulator